jgi:Tfp pilus assembly protein PilO
MGALSRLTRQQIAIIGSVLIVLTTALLFFFLIRPLRERLAAANDKYNTRQAVADTRGEKEKALEQARQEVAQARAQWSRYDRRFMPDINISNLIRGMEQRWREQKDVLGPLVTRFLRRDRSVRVIRAGITVPAPPTDPNAIDTRVIEIPLGEVSVLGSFRNILNHAERWNKFDRLVLVDNLRLAGNSPLLVGQYRLTCYIFTRGEPGPDVPAAGGTQGGGGEFPGGEYGAPGFEGGAPEGVAPEGGSAAPL